MPEEKKITKYILCATVEDRIDQMLICAESINAHLPDWKVLVVCQEYTYDSATKIRAVLPNAEIEHLPQRIGMHSAKIYGLCHIRIAQQDDPYVVCSVDDDMQFLETTNLEPCVETCCRPLVGLVSAGWVKSATALKNHKPKNR